MRSSHHHRPSRRAWTRETAHIGDIAGFRVGMTGSVLVDAICACGHRRETKTRSSSDPGRNTTWKGGPSW